MIIIFGNVIYYDDKKVSDYISIILGNHDLKINKYEFLSDNSGKIDLKVIGADLKGSKKYIAEVKESMLYNCNRFEALLKDRDDFFDCTIESFDIQTIGRSNIVKLNGYIYVPEEFDMTQTIQKFKPLLMDSISTDCQGETEKKLFQTFFESKDTKIPVKIESDDYILCSKLNSSNMIIEYEELEEFEELETTIIARTMSTTLVNKNKPFYDPLKDFVKLNRSLRRSIGERTDGLYEIYSDVDYKSVEIIAIYQ